MNIWYLESSLFLTQLLRDRPDSVVRACERWLDRADQGEVSLITSTLTWDEVCYVAGRGLKGKGGSYDAQRAAEAGALLLGLRGLRIEAVDEAALHEAGDLIRRTGLKPRDALHAALARRHALGQMLTLDADFSTRMQGCGLTLTAVA